MSVIASCAAGAEHALRRRCGFSPSQWAMGKEPRLPTCLVDGTPELPAHDRARTADGAKRCVFASSRQLDRSP